MIDMKIVPVFLPQMGCKKRCLFCDQRSATGFSQLPSIEELNKMINKYIAPDERFEIAFYGGTFTALPVLLQKRYLAWADEYIRKNVCDGIRISTRPDEINKENLIFLKKNGVKFVELGAQSFCDDVLHESERNHSSKDIEKACTLLKELKIDFGLHLMIGLPGDEKWKDLFSSWKTVENGAKTCRLHPTIVLKGAPLESLYLDGRYRAVRLDEAIDICSDMMAILESNNVKVIRIGLFVPDELMKNIVAGPYHPRFGELVKGELLKKVVKFVDPELLIYTEKQASIVRNLDVKAIAGRELGFVVNKRFVSWKDALKEYVSGGVEDVRAIERTGTSRNQCSNRSSTT
ncbi:MAG TPA: radical SAM protein [Pseudothermotoga sp.]|nr:radical SAM protein [Pseudothermotoga sp.]HBT26034.1 radical SAM protein [Pseudothermotoga sp.]